MIFNTSIYGKSIPDLSNPGSSGDLLEGKQLVDQDGNIITGTMTNNGAISQTLSAGSSYSIPEGYHNGSGSVNAKAVSVKQIYRANIGTATNTKTLVITIPSEIDINTILYLSIFTPPVNIDMGNKPSFLQIGDFSITQIQILWKLASAENIYIIFDSLGLTDYEQISQMRPEGKFPRSILSLSGQTMTLSLVNTSVDYLSFMTSDYNSWSIDCFYMV